MNEIESDEEPSNEIDLMQSLVDEMPDEQEILQEAEISIDEELEANVDFDDNQIGKENSDYSVLLLSMMRLFLQQNFQISKKSTD